MRSKVAEYLNSFKSWAKHLKLTDKKDPPPSQFATVPTAENQNTEKVSLFQVLDTASAVNALETADRAVFPRDLWVLTASHLGQAAGHRSRAASPSLQRLPPRVWACGM